VLERIFAAERAFVAEAEARSLEGSTDAEPERVLAAIVGSFLDFLAARPSYVRLLEREALAGGAALRATAAHAATIREGLGLASELLRSGTGDAPGRAGASAPAALMLALLSLCWFPFAHADTYGRDLGLDLREPAARARYRDYVVGLVLRGIAAS